MPSLHVFIAGRVQGVGFRYATGEKARTLGLSGWARNLPDGRVEALFIGERESLEGMLLWCRRGPSFARVELVEEIWGEDAAPLTGFEIRR